MHFLKQEESQPTEFKAQMVGKGWCELFSLNARVNSLHESVDDQTNVSHSIKILDV